VALAQTIHTVLQAYDEQKLIQAQLEMALFHGSVVNGLFRLTCPHCNLLCQLHFAR